ncbi:MAG: hypothetical protein KDC80_10490 [Saprospiraceae bacterium]|nr:hypothetical protein [Saprospiraceae bacterium]
MGIRNCTHSGYAGNCTGTSLNRFGVDPLSCNVGPSLISPVFLSLDHCPHPVPHLLAKHERGNPSVSSTTNTYEDYQCNGWSFEFEEDLIAVNRPSENEDINLKRLLSGNGQYSDSDIYGDPGVYFHSVGSSISQTIDYFLLYQRILI